MRLLTCLTLTAFLASCASKPQTGAGAADAAHSAIKAGQTGATTEVAKDSAAVKEVMKDEKELTGVGVTCTKGKDERTLSVVKPEAGGCEVTYTKFGNTQTVASAKNEGVTYCEGVVTKMKTNLETSGYACK